MFCILGANVKEVICISNELEASKVDDAKMAA